MIQDLGMIRPGSTININFDSFDGGDGSSSATTGLVVGDIKVYNVNLYGLIERVSTSGYAVDLDFDAITGVNGVQIDLADNGSIGFFTCGSDYLVVIDNVTIDTETVSFTLARFSIGYPAAIWNTYIATSTSATRFRLAKGPAEADVIIGCPVILHDIASEVQFALGVVSDYIVTTKEVFLAKTPVGFTPGTWDAVGIFMPSNVEQWRRGDVPAPAATGVPDVNATHISDDSGAADNLELQYDGTGLSGEGFPASQAQVGNIGTSLGGALHFVVEDDNTDGLINGEGFVGVETSGTFLVTEAEDGTRHVVDSDGGALELVYQVDVGVRVASELIFKGFLTGANDSLDIEVYDFVGAAWEVRGALVGKAGTTNITQVVSLLPRNTGTSGVDENKVYVRFIGSGLTSAVLNTDELVVEAVESGLLSSSHAELSALPGATPTGVEMLQFLYQYFKFKRIGSGSTAQEIMFMADQLTQLASAELSSDGTDFTRAEFS